MTREEAIRRIKAWNLDADDMEVLSEVIPELRESDNKIHREWILEYLYDGLQKSDEQFKGLFKSAIDWLEKQKEQRDYRKLYEDIAQSEWFKKAYVGKGTDDESLISNVQIEEEFPKIIPDEKMKQMGEQISKAAVDNIKEQFSKIIEEEPEKKRKIQACISYALANVPNEKIKNFGVSLQDCLDYVVPVNKGLREEPVDLEKAAEEYADKHGFRVPYDGSNNFYDDVDVKASLEGFKAGAKWMAEQIKGGSK